MPPKIPYREAAAHYRAGGNVMQLLREATPDGRNTPEAVLIAYDLQAGSYVRAMRQPTHRAAMTAYTRALAELFDSLGAETVLEAGVGEATTLAHVVRHMTRQPRRAAGFDISWSRVFTGLEYAATCEVDLRLFVADLFATPLPDGAFDVVYTSHSIEPNRGRERAALEELYRIAGKFLVLLEPAGTLGNEATQDRIRRHGYCTDLHATALELGYTVREHRLFDVCIADANQTELIVLEKPETGRAERRPEWSCPQCRRELIAHAGHWFCGECGRVYPVLAGIACLAPSAGILAGRFTSARSDA